MTRTPHLSPEDLVRAATSGGSSAGVEVHLAACRTCRGEVESFRALGERLREEASGPGDAALLHVYRLVRDRLGPRPAERVRFSLPGLIYDSLNETSLLGVRGEGGERRLAWRGAAADVEVRWGDFRPGGTNVMTGQVLPNQPSNESLVGDVWLEERGEATQWTLLDPSGEFTLPAPRGRSWQILVRWGDLELRLRP